MLSQNIDDDFDDTEYNRIQRLRRKGREDESEYVPNSRRKIIERRKKGSVKYS
jgi:hypothetical protein